MLNKTTVVRQIPKATPKHAGGAITGLATEVLTEEALEGEKELSLNVQSAPRGEELVGGRVEVWWEGERRWFAGVVEAYSSSTGKHRIRYDDGDETEEQLEGYRVLSVVGLSNNSDSHASERARQDSELQSRLSPVASGAKRCAGAWAELGLGCW